MAVVIWYVLATSLTEVLDFVASLVVEFHRRMVLGGLQFAFSCFSFLGQRQLSSATVITMGLSQVIHGPTHNSGHLPKPIFLSEQRKDVLNFWKLLVSDLSWLNYSLMSLQYSDTTLLHWKPISIRLVHHRWLMDLTAEGRLGLFQKVWYMIQLRSRWPLGMGEWLWFWTESSLNSVSMPIVPRILHGIQKNKESWRGPRDLEHHWWTSKSKNDWTWTTAKLDPLMMIRVVKCNYFPALITSADSFSVALFQMTWTLLGRSSSVVHLQVHCENMLSIWHLFQSGFTSGYGMRWHWSCSWITSGRSWMA